MSILGHNTASYIDWGPAHRRDFIQSKLNSSLVWMVCID